MRLSSPKVWCHDPGDTTTPRHRPRARLGRAPRPGASLGRCDRASSGSKRSKHSVGRTSPSTGLARAHVEGLQHVGRPQLLEVESPVGCIGGTSDAAPEDRLVALRPTQEKSRSLLDLEDLHQTTTRGFPGVVLRRLRGPTLERATWDLGVGLLTHRRHEAVRGVEPGVRGRNCGGTSPEDAMPAMRAVESGARGQYQSIPGARGGHDERFEAGAGGG